MLVQRLSKRRLDNDFLSFSVWYGGLNLFKLFWCNQVVAFLDVSSELPILRKRVNTCTPAFEVWNNPIKFLFAGR